MTQTSEMWDEWRHIFLTVADRHAPPITNRKVRSEYAPWITSEIKNLIEKKGIKLDQNNSMTLLPKNEMSLKTDKKN